MQNIIRTNKLNDEKQNIPLIVGAWVVIAIFIWRFRNFQLDDAYITYRYARNLAQGLGFSYNPPQRVFGTTTPLYTLILALFSLIGFDIPQSSLVLCWLGQALVIWIFATVKRSGGSNLILLLSLLIILPGSYLVLGMETSLYTGLVLLSLYEASRKRFSIAIVLSSAVTLIRYDGVILTSVLLIFEWISTHKLPLKSGVLFFALIMPWLLYANETFGSVLPNTFFAKTNGAGGSDIFIKGIGPQLLTLMFFIKASIQTGYIIALFTTALFIWNITSAKSAFECISSTWALLYLIAYSLIGLRYDFHWYYYPVIPSLLMVIGMFIKKTSEFLEKAGCMWIVQQIPLLFLGLPIFLAMALGTFMLDNQGEYLASVGGRQIVYPPAGKWICEHSGKNATILVPEIGIIGWYCNRTIIDPYGLVTPEMLPYIKTGESIQGEALMRPDFIVIPNVDINEVNPSVPFADDWQDQYQIAKVFKDKRYIYQLIIFEKSH